MPLSWAPACAVNEGATLHSRWASRGRLAWGWRGSDGQRPQAPEWSHSERVDQRLEGARLVTPARVVQEVALEGQAPVIEHPHERAARDVFGHVPLERERQPDAA